PSASSVSRGANWPPPKASSEMNRPRSKLYKAALILALVPLLALSGLTQRRLNQDRVALGVTRGEPLGQTAPPVLVFTTVALGGFRGLIANALWIREMDEVLHGTDYQALINPQTDDEKERSRILREKYKLDPLHMKAVDDEFGPLEWRLPEAHAIYWATLGLKRARKEEQITLRREI